MEGSRRDTQWPAGPHPCRTAPGSGSRRHPQIDRAHPTALVAPRNVGGRPARAGPPAAIATPETPAPPPSRRARAAPRPTPAPSSHRAGDPPMVRRSRREAAVDDQVVSRLESGLCQPIQSGPLALIGSSGEPQRIEIRERLIPEHRCALTGGWKHVQGYDFPIVRHRHP